jgi:WD40 repeat protein
MRDQRTTTIVDRSSDVIAEIPRERLAFDPDGSKLASSGNEGIARVWALDLDDLIEIAREELTRGFTDDECRRYLHVGACPSP